MLKLILFSFSMDDLDQNFLTQLQKDLTVIAVLESSNTHAMAEMRRIIL
jgi:hypothetical protein